VEWLFGAAILMVVASVVMTVASPTKWALSAVRLRYLAMGVLFIGLGLYLSIGGIVRWIDWGSLMVGLFVLAMGGVYLYARGGIGPGNQLR
jgi:hypothetical protein